MTKEVAGRRMSAAQLALTAGFPGQLIANKDDFSDLRIMDGATVGGHFVNQFDRVNGAAGYARLKSALSALVIGSDSPETEAVFQAKADYAQTADARYSLMNLVQSVDGMAGASAGDFRTLYARTDLDTDQAVTKAVAGSFYLYHNGGGNTTEAFGGTIQDFIWDAATHANVRGGMGAAWLKDFGGHSDWMRGWVASGSNDQTSGLGVDLGYGLHAIWTNSLAGSTTTTAVAGFNEIYNKSTISSATAMRAEINNLGGVITNGFSQYARLDNTGGAVTNYYGYYAAPHVGTAPSGNDYALYFELDALSYFAGNVGIGDNTPSEAKLVVRENGAGATAHFAGGNDNYDIAIFERDYSTGGASATLGRIRVRSGSDGSPHFTIDNETVDGAFSFGVTSDDKLVIEHGVGIVGTHIMVFHKDDNISVPTIPVYADDAAAGTGGLSANMLYKTSTGEVRIKT